jgi:hypothetical protein
MTAAASKQREEQAIGVLKIGGMEFDVEDFLGGLEMAAAGGGGAPAIPDRSDPAFGTFSAAQATRFVGADPIQSAMLEELRGIHRENKKRKRIEVDE